MQLEGKKERKKGRQICVRRVAEHKKTSQDHSHYLKSNTKENAMNVTRVYTLANERDKSARKSKEQHEQEHCK
jgi:hypothetical protein